MLALGFPKVFAGTEVDCPVLAVYSIVTSVEYRSRLLTVVRLSVSCSLYIYAALSVQYVLGLLSKCDAALLMKKSKK